ncbi:MAG: hypothetical protein IPH72_11750 [Sandaracinaceae bacterium]|nr:hypothetical protein [Sandaracinaceae bacterium]
MKRIAYTMVLSSIIGCSGSNTPQFVVDGSVGSDAGATTSNDMGSEADSGGSDFGSGIDGGTRCVGPESPYIHLSSGNSARLDLSGETSGNEHTITFWARWPQTSLASIALTFGHGATLQNGGYLVFGRGTDGRATLQKEIDFSAEELETRLRRRTCGTTSR